MLLKKADAAAGPPFQCKYRTVRSLYLIIILVVLTAQKVAFVPLTAFFNTIGREGTGSFGVNDG